MKHLYKTLLVLIVAVSAFACDDYLDVVPKGKKVPTETGDYQMLLRNTSAMFFAQDIFGYLTDESYPMFSSMFVTEETPILKTHFFADESRERAKYIEEDALYNRCYHRIAVYNSVIEGIDDVEGPAAEKQMLKAQARVLRAYNHFVLVNCYAKHYNPSTAHSDNGIITVTAFDMESVLPQQKVAAVYDLILEDIEAALEHLPGKTITTFDAGQAFGYALLAKVRLFRGEYEAALKAANQSLELNNHIFDLITYSQTQNGHSYELPENLLTRFGLNDQGLNFSIWSPDFIEKFEADENGTKVDARYLQGFNEGFPGMTPGVHFFGNFDYKANVTGFKTTEVYLMKAECLARAGQLEGAMAEVNKVRVKRILPAHYKALTAQTKQEAMRIIMDERLKESFGSFNRFWDIRRLANEPDYAIHVKKTFTDATGVTHNIELNPNSHLLILPFSREAVNRNSSLEQNSK